MRVLTLVFIFEALVGGLVLCQEGKRDDTHVENVVRQAVADEFSSEINTNRTRAYLSCASGEMVIKVNFSEPFRGVTYTDYDRSSPCKFYGDGSRYYELRIPLKGCGTKQEAPRVFINNIIVRFHRSLELEEDEIKTIICRYPPPLAPTQVPIVLPPPTAAVPVLVPPKLSEIELLLIICALLFLTLLLLGIGVAYYCLKRRNIKVVRKAVPSSIGPGSEITKLSGSMFDQQIRIPRAVAQSTSGSEAALLTSSDYPSDPPSSLNSDVEEVVAEGGGRRTVVSDLAQLRADHFRYENTAFVNDEDSSVLSGYPEDQERAASVSSIPVQQILVEQAKRLPKARLAREQVLTTIAEREDAMLQREALQKTYAAVRAVPPLHSPAPYSQPYARQAPPSSYAPSLYGSIPDNDDRSQAELIEDAATMRPPPPPSSYAPSLKGSIPDNDIWSHSELESEVAVMPYKPKRETATVTDYFLSTQRTTETEDDISRLDRTTTVALRKPKITIHNIDDVFLTTTTEVHATETTTKTTKDTIAQHVKAPPPPPPPPAVGWDVSIRGGRWDAYSEVSEKFRDAESTTTEIRRHHLPEQPLYEQHASLLLLQQVLEPPPVEGVELLTPEVKERWRTCVTTDETFRYLVQEANTVEEYIRITKDSRYERLFDTRTWHVIIRALSAPPRPLYRKGPRAPSSRRTSCAEYDLRSVTEMDVDFAHADRESLSSADTGYTYRTARSLAERSTSEFLEDVPTMEPPHRHHHFAEHSSYDPSSSYQQQQQQSAAFYSSSSYHEQDSRRMDCVVQQEMRSHKEENFFETPVIPRAAIAADREEIKSVTETDVVDWKR